MYHKRRKLHLECENHLQLNLKFKRKIYLNKKLLKIIGENKLKIVKNNARILSKKITHFGPP